MTPEANGDAEAEVTTSKEPVTEKAAVTSSAPSASEVQQMMIARQLALAEAIKPLEAPTADLYAPDREAARRAVSEKYKAAVAQDGDLRRKIDAASTNFDNTAADMVGRLDDWTDNLNAGALHDLLESRATTRAKLGATLGQREAARDAAVEAAKVWAARFADWSAPADAIGKVLASYADQIAKLNADINNNVARDAAILSFWFEVAPKHLQISVALLSQPAKDALTKVKSALVNAGYDDLADSLDPATARNAGGVYDIDPADLPEHRMKILKDWKDAAEARADAEADFKLHPDDAATLKQRWDKLKGDAWIKDAKAALPPSAA